jgi:pyroglutamyl-peptidase
MQSLLLTSFTIWEDHHRTNASDDLLAAVSVHPARLSGCHYLRQLPVDFDAAPAQVRQAIATLNPSGVVLCGMAEQRTDLSVESNGRDRHNPALVRHTAVDLAQLIAPCNQTQISHDAGNFVCGHTYYQVLRYLEGTIPCIFVHVPLLTRDRHTSVVEDFIVVVQQMHRLTI